MQNYAFIFPGQGSQALGMGKEFYENFPITKELFMSASDSIKVDFKALLFEPNDNLNLTPFTQPAIFLVSAVAYQIFRQECDIQPTLAFGHSLGEVSAYALFCGLDFEHAIRLTHERGLLMSKACEGQDAGMMVVVGIEDGVLEKFCTQAQNDGKKVWCANYNGNAQVVLAGKKTDLTHIQDSLKTLGAKRTLLLPMSVASHCPMLESITDDFKGLLDSLVQGDSSVPILSNATLQTYTSKADAKELLTKQLTQSVLYQQSVCKVDSQVDAFIEFGHGGVLKGLNKRLSQKPTFTLSDLQSLKEILEFIQTH